MPLLSQVHEILRVTFQKLIARCHMPDCSGLRLLVSTSDVVTLIFVFSFFGFISLEMKLVALHYIVFKVQSVFYSRFLNRGFSIILSFLFQVNRYFLASCGEKNVSLGEALLLVGYIGSLTNFALRNATLM